MYDKKLLNNFDLTTTTRGPTQKVLFHSYKKSEKCIDKKTFFLNLVRVSLEKNVYLENFYKIWRFDVVVT